MWLCHVRHLRSVSGKELPGSMPGDRLEGIKVNGVVGNDAYTRCRLQMKGTYKRKILLRSRWEKKDFRQGTEVSIFYKM